MCKKFYCELYDALWGDCIEKREDFNSLEEANEYGNNETKDSEGRLTFIAGVV